MDLAESGRRNDHDLPEASYAPRRAASTAKNSPTVKKERHLVADDSSGGTWDPIVTPWHLDEHIPAFPVPASATETICPTLPAGPVPARMSLLHQAVAGAVARAARPLVLSGDCPTALGVVAGLQRRYRDLAVVWLDAHGDFNTPAISISGYLGGMALAMLTGRTPELLSDALGLRPVADTDVVLADARDLDPAERDALTVSPVRRVPADPAAITSALDGLGRMPVYLHLDIDVIDSAQLPGLRFPSGPGPALTQIEDCLAAVCATADVRAACIACAWLPDRISDQTTREAITRLAGALGADLAWHQPVGR
jgi:arginase